MRTPALAGRVVKVSRGKHARCSACAKVRRRETDRARGGKR